MNAGSENETEARADFLPALQSLRDAGATKRCLQTVTGRLADLPDASKRACVGIIRNARDVPGQRRGKVDTNAALAFATRVVAFDRWLFLRLFPYWIELLADFPDNVQRVAHKVAPNLDFGSAPWSAISATADQIAGQMMPPQRRADVLLALFAHRFRDIFSPACGPGSLSMKTTEADRMSPVPSDTAVEDSATAADSSTPCRARARAPENLASESDDSKPRDAQSIASQSLDDGVRAGLESTLQQLRELRTTSSLWDDAIPAFVAAVQALSREKLEARSSASQRSSISASLDALKTDAVDELIFLRLRDQCNAWSVESVEADALETAANELKRLAASLELHRTARLAAQSAASDEELETQMATRQQAKREVLSAVTALDAAMRRRGMKPRLGEPVSIHLDERLSRGAARSELAAPLSTGPSTMATTGTTAIPGGAADTSTAHSITADEAETTGSSPVDPSVRTTLTDAAVAESVPAPSVAAADAAQAVVSDAERADEVVSATASPGEAAAVDTSARLPSAATESPEASAAPAAEETSAVAVPAIPSVLSSYEQFRETHWVDASGEITAPPWAGSTFVETLIARAVDELDSEPASFWKLLIFARAIEASGGRPPVHSADVRSAAALWAKADSPSAGLDPERCERLRAFDPLQPESGQRVALVLEALRPSRDRQLLTHEIDALIAASDFESGALRVVVERLLTAHAFGHDALALLRHVEHATPERGRQLDVRFSQSRGDLQTLVTRVWSAAGGRVQRTHCRRAWNEFVEYIQPTVVRLYPLPRGDDSWSPSDIEHELESFEGELVAICDRHEAKWDDKRHMLRTAGEIADAARRVVALRREQASASEAKHPPVVLPRVEIDQLRGLRLPAPEEEFAKRLLLRAVDQPSLTAETHPLGITVHDLCVYPDLLRVIRDIPPESINALRSAKGGFAYADDIPEPVRAAAVLLFPSPAPKAPDIEALVSMLEDSHRAPLLGLIVPVLDERLQRRVHAERADALSRLANGVSRLSHDVDNLTQLGNRFAASVRKIRDNASEVIEGGDVRLDTRLTEAWLRDVHEVAARCVTEHVAALTSEAERREDGDEIRGALARGFYGRAVRMLYGHGGIELRSSRQTDWRDDARVHRDESLKRLFATTDSKVRPLVDAWRLGLKGDVVHADRTLRTAFVRLVTDGRHMDRESVAAYIAIPVLAVTSELVRDQLMPSWMPQLHRFGRLVVLTPPVPPDAPSFRQATLAKLAEFPQDLVVFLTPRLSEVRRGEVLSELRRRGAAAALIDDLDLVRLINPGGERPHMLLGLLEIVLEQQRRGSFSPFELPEGSQTRLEMYVGRRDKARELARTANYSRLFSGRKLGKSALLRFIERTEDGTQLPSGHVLRVVYVPAVGIESEPAMVDSIIASLESSLAIKFVRRGDVAPVEQLDAALRDYLETQKKTSLLVVLDEADVFFEGQLHEYEEKRERCLSFQMRSRFTAVTDGQGLPRVRFVFAGYRVTNRSQGAWSNWGLVLSLEPLDPEDAARLVAGPLAVMGIDLGAHAHEVAYRCGYQPAILLRFGERLIDHIERQPHRSGDRHVVTAADVAQVLEDQRVHEEIRTIARNNFEGNPVGLVVFGAVLAELLELPPGQALRDAPERILERLRAIDPDLSWLEREGDGTATIRGYLAEFVERSLLRERRVGGEPSYALRFPHHLPIIATLCDTTRIKDELRRLRARGTSKTEDCERALVAPRVLRDLADAVQLDSGALGVVGTLWQAGAYDPAGGIPDRLGLTSDEIVDAQQALEGHPLATVRAIRHVDAVAAEHLSRELREARVRPLLLGGVDLLRWALERRRSETQMLYEVHGVGRMSPARLTWWFQRLRGLEFARPDSIERIYAKTAGIPVLVDVVDRQLKSAAGTTVAATRVDLAISAVDEALPFLARDLETGRPAMVLESREREILQLAHWVVQADVSAGRDLRVALTDMWELFADKCSIAPLGVGDSLSLEVLLELGLLPTTVSARSEEPLARLGGLSADDPVFALVRAFKVAAK